jgi:hypothetical protein
VQTVLLFTGSGMASGGWVVGAIYDYVGFYAAAFAAGIVLNRTRRSSPDGYWQRSDVAGAPRDAGQDAVGLGSAEPAWGTPFLTGTYMTDCPGSGFGHVARSFP